MRPTEVRNNPSLSPFIFYIATTSLADGELRSLERLHRLGLLKAVRLYTTQPKGMNYQGIAESIGILDKLTIITHDRPVAMGVFTAAAMDLGWLAGQEHPDSARIVLVTNQRPVHVLADWANQHQCDWIILPSLCDAVITQLLEAVAIRYDEIAIRVCRGLVKDQGTSSVRLSDWSQKLFEECPELANSLQRKDLVGRRRFSEYVRVLGATGINGDLWQYNKKSLRPRPLPSELRAVYEKEHKPTRPTLFLRWSNRVLQQWPALNDAQVRRWLFDTTSMEQIARQVGLIRRDQLLEVQIPLQNQSP